MTINHLYAQVVRFQGLEKVDAQMQLHQLVEEVLSTQVVMTLQ